MATKNLYVDATGDPSLSRLAAEVRDSNRPHIIKLDGEEIAVVTPVRHRRPERAISEADSQAFLAALGGWKDVDTDRLVQDIYTARRAGDRPLVEL
jgi:hypothetical protein